MEVNIMDYSFKKQIMEEKRHGRNVIRIPFEISGNHNDYACFNVPRHVSVIEYIEKKNPHYQVDCAAYDSEVFHYGQSVRWSGESYSVSRTIDSWGRTHLLGWHDENEHWGDRYYHEDGTDKTNELYRLITSNHPSDLVKGLMSDFKEMIYDMNQLKSL